MNQLQGNRTSPIPKPANGLLNTQDGGLTGPSSRPVVINLVLSHRGTVLLLAGISFIGALAEAGFLVLMTMIAMALLNGQQTIQPVPGWQFPIGLSLAASGVALLIKLGFAIASVRISSQLTANVTLQQRSFLARSFLGASWPIQQREPAGRLQELLTGFVGAAGSVVTTLTAAVTATLSLLAFLVTGMVVDAVSTLGTIGMLTLAGLILTPIRRRIRNRASAAAEAGLVFANSVSELGSLGQEMQVFGVRDEFIERIDESSARTVGTNRRVQNLQGSLSPIYISLAYAALLGGVALLTVTGTSNLAVLGSVLLLMLRSLSYAQQLASAAGAVASKSPYLDQMREMADRYLADSVPIGTSIPQDGVAPIVMDGASYSYGDGPPSLRDASFRIEGGEVVGVVGPSGAGKSTLIQLLLGLRVPQTGSVSAGGVDLRDVDKNWWSRQVSFVAQEANLFTGTVAENLSFFRAGLSDSSLIRALELANIRTEVEALPEGLHTHLGQRGSQLSGGQRQRISIARALVGTPSLIILDEPTSALDARSESLVRDSLSSIKGQATIVIVAHRLSTLDICDKIVVVEDGRVTSVGTPDTVRAESQYFRRALVAAGLSTEPI